MKMLIYLLAIASILGTPLFAMNPHSNDERQTVFILLGAPGAGKGTQASRLSDIYGVPQISTGDLFRDNLRNNTSIGQKAKAYMDQGQLVPDAVVLDMLFDRLSKADCEKGYILDGVPRTIPQAEILDKHLEKANAHIIVISLEVSDETLVERLCGRLVCDTCGAIYHKISSPPKVSDTCDRDGGKLIQRKDDTEVVIKERLRVFHEQTEPVKGHYQQKGTLLLVDSSVSKEKTISEIDAHLVNTLPKK